MSFRALFVVSALSLVTAWVQPALAGSAQGYVFGKPGEAAQADRTVEINLGDMYFEPESVEVKAGETVRFLVKNQGSLLHELNLGTAAMHAEHQREMLKMQQSGMLTPTGMNHAMGQMDHGAMDHGQMGAGSMGHGQMMPHDEPNSVLIEPGKSAALTWTFAQATAIEFACNIPGHYQAGMVGTLKVN